MKSIKFNDSKHSLISSFSEMNQNQFLQISLLRSKYLTQSASEKEYNSLRIQAFKILSDLNENQINSITAEQWIDLLPEVDFSLLETPILKTNLLPQVTISKVRLYGPSGLMDKCTIDEFTRIDTAFINASNFKNTDALVTMFSYMYRPKRKDLKLFKSSPNWNGDVREEFNGEKCKARVDFFKLHVPTYMLVANYLYFSSVRKQRFEILKYLFAETESKIHLDDRGWAGSMLQLSHSGVFGNFDQQMKQNWFTVMVEMDRLSEQNVKSVNK